MGTTMTAPVLHAAPSVGPEAFVDANEFEAATGEALERVLDIATWRSGEDLGDLYQRLEQVVAGAVEQEDRIRTAMRATVFPRLRERAAVPPGAGVYQARVEDIEKVHRGLLFPGRVEACDGTIAMHDTLPLTVTQIGVCMVSYQGDQGAWVQRVLRRDLTINDDDPVELALAALDRRRDRGGLEQEGRRDRLSDLARRGIMAFAERAALLYRSDAPWRMGHGNPLATELLTGSGFPELVDRSLPLLTDLVAHRRWVFVPSAPPRWLHTVGNALRPLEYAIVDTHTDAATRLLEGGYRGEWGDALLQKARAFVADVAPMVIVGLYRASAMAPAQVFYAHRDHAHEAALIALADSVLQEHRGFPMLIDLADLTCKGVFDPASFAASTQLAYVEAGQPFRYLPERRTRA
jgi:hypothetical protein